MAYPPIAPLPSPPSRQDPANFATEADAFLGALPTFQSEVNAAGSYIDAKAISVGNTFVGNYSAGTTYVIGQSVLYTDGIFYISIANANVGNAPDVSPTKWAALPDFSLANYVGNVSITGDVDLNGDVTFGNAIVETVYALSGTTPALDPSNGTVQTWTLSANSSPTDSLASGESLTLMIDDGTAYTITWPSVTWKTDGGVAPTLNTTGLTAIQLWKVSTTLYGARVGDA